jgi:hypothetical protein
MKTLTRNGILFDLVEPNVLDVDWDATAWSAANSNRWNGHPERQISLASHMHSVGLAAQIFLAEHQDNAAHVPGLTGLRRETWAHALAATRLLGHIHDCPETVTGDMTTPWRLSLSDRIMAKLFEMGLKGSDVVLAGAVLKDEMEAPAIHAVFEEASGLTAALAVLGPDVERVVRRSVAQADRCALHFEFEHFSQKTRLAHPGLFSFADADSIPWDELDYMSVEDQALSWRSNLRDLMERVAHIKETKSP